MRALPVVALAMVSAAVFASTADATTYRGKTKQGKHASVVTAADGTPTRLFVAWRAPCRKPGFVFVERTLWTPPFVTAAPGQVADHGVLRDRYRNGDRARLTLSITGSLGADGSWHGVFQAKVVLTRNGKWLDTCRLKRDRWVAHPVS